MLIRPFAAKDYPEIARVTCAALPEYPTAPEEMEFQDSRRDPKCLHRRWVTEDDGGSPSSVQITEAPAAKLRGPNACVQQEGKNGRIALRMVGALCGRQQDIPLLLGERLDLVGARDIGEERPKLHLAAGRKGLLMQEPHELF